MNICMHKTEVDLFQAKIVRWFANLQLVFNMFAEK